MIKSIRLSLNRFGTVPSSLLDPDGTAVETVTVDLARLYHHYYQDNHGCAPPNPDPAQFEPLNHLGTETDFRARGDGFGTNPGYRKNKSHELGQAFFRWFLYEHLGITYFAHMSAAFKGRLETAFQGIQVTRSPGGGDAPDYLCASDLPLVYLGEAKGRTTSISFNSAEFGRWRRQLSNVVVRDASGVERSLKGYIVATRFASEEQHRTFSRLLAEDPESPGKPWPDGAAPLRNAIVSIHYAQIVEKLRQPLLSAVLLNLVTVPNEIRFPGVVWECLISPLNGRRFVGGYYPSAAGFYPFELTSGNWIFSTSNFLRLDTASGTFVGLEEDRFKKIVAAARQGTSLLGEVRTSEDVPPFYSGMSFLRDGSIVGPVEMFRPIDQTFF